MIRPLPLAPLLLRSCSFRPPRRRSRAWAGREPPRRRRRDHPPPHRAPHRRSSRSRRRGRRSPAPPPARPSVRHHRRPSAGGARAAARRRAARGARATARFRREHRRARRIAGNAAARRRNAPAAAGAAAGAAAAGAATAAITRPPEPEPPPPAAPPKPVLGTVTGLPLPRFAALGSNQVNLRIGPDLRYRIDWTYQRRDLPVQIIEEHQIWRKIRDPEGTEGWVQRPLLNARRTFLVQGEERALRRRPDAEAPPVARLKPGVIGLLRRCEAGSAWCEVRVANHAGWLRRSEIWGVGAEEAIE